jgi:hypothetical protein
VKDRQGPVDVVRGVVQVRGEPQGPPPVRHLDPPLPQPGVQDRVPRTVLVRQEDERRAAGQLPRAEQIDPCCVEAVVKALHQPRV